MNTAKTPIKQRVRHIIQFDWYAKHASTHSFISESDAAWIQDLGDDYIWCVTSETQKHHVVAIWASHKVKEGAHAVLDAIDELMADDNTEIIGRNG